MHHTHSSTLSNSASDISDKWLLRRQGADITSAGVRYQTWSEHDWARVIITEKNGTKREVQLDSVGDGFWSALDPMGQAGDFYKFEFSNGAWPDPASRFQPHGVHDVSMVIDPGEFQWSDHNWRSQPLENLIFYEIHVGTFSEKGSFCGAIERLPHLVKLGVTALELMPVADFPGQYNWGYDGVALFAPSRVYGTPDDLRSLVNKAHVLGLNVFLDVVYNHLGPDGNYLSAYQSEYFHPTHMTPWGPAFDFSKRLVRDFFLQNLDYWMREFHVDGFRLDATHSIRDDSEKHILTEMAELIHERGRLVIAEDNRNDPMLLRPEAQGGNAFDACWADDFHHVIHVLLTNGRDPFYSDYVGSASELVTTLRKGWLMPGPAEKLSPEPVDQNTADLSPPKFVHCLSNHDQAGNRPLGERLNHLVSAEAYRAVSALLCLAPYTPLLFMGQEWGTHSPFQYFTDHRAELGEKVWDGRRHQFKGFVGNAGQTQEVPNPQDPTTFSRCKLDWAELSEPNATGLFALHVECLHLRKNTPFLQQRARNRWRVSKLAGGVIAILFTPIDASPGLLVADLKGSGLLEKAIESLRLATNGEWSLVFSSNEVRFSASGNVSAETRLFEWVPSQSD